MDQNDSGADFPYHSSKMEQLTEKESFDNEILVAATVMQRAGREPPWQKTMKTWEKEV